MKQISILFFALFPLLSFAQGLTGVWKGKLKQNPNKVFYFEIRIDQANEDGTIVGTCYIESYGEAYSKKGDYGTIDFNGTWNGNSVIIQESAVIRDEKKSSNFYWCIANLQLTVKEENNEQILEGPWTAPGGCVPGTLKVSKEITPFQSAEYCIDNILNDWKKQGKYEAITDYQNRVNTRTKELKIDELKQTCICKRFNWDNYGAQHLGDSIFCEIWSPEFEKFKIYVRKNEVDSMMASITKLKIDSVVCDLDYETKKFKIKYMALKDPSSNKTYTTIPFKDPVIVKDSIQLPVIKTIDTLENRVVETRYQIDVMSKEISLEVWDNNLVDGDIISLNLNGEWIMRNFKVKKGKKKIIITLTEKDNMLIMHAENLGTKPPNTAAIIINDGVKGQMIVLNSDQGKSEAIKIKVN